jgi:hypothetical protein
MNRELLDAAISAVREMNNPGGNKVAFVPGPSVQGQLQRLQALAAEQQSDAMAANQATQQIQAQGQGAPPAMRIEDLAAILDQGFQGLAQLIASIPAQIQQTMAAQASQASATGGGSSAGGGGEKKPKKEDMVVAKLDEMITLLRSATGAPPPPPPGAAGAMPPPDAAAAQGAPPPGADPNAQQMPMQ